MFCRKCGKEISDDSEFCYSCGSKVEIKEKKDITSETSSSIDDVKTSTETHDIPPLIVNTEKTPESQETIQETNDDKILREYLEKKNSNKLKTNKEIGYGWGWLILLSFYGSGLSMGIKNNPSLSVTNTQMYIEWIGYVGLLTFYFWFRFFLIRRNFWKGNIPSSSCLSGMVSYIIFGILVTFSLSFVGNYEKGKDSKYFLNNMKTQSEIFKKQELEYSKMMDSEPKTQSELNDKILKVDEYKNFLIKKNEHFISCINFYRQINSKYKKNKSIDEQITKLETINRDGIKTSGEVMDLYKKYLITGDDKYFNKYIQESEKLQKLTDEVKILVTNIGNSL